MIIFSEFDNEAICHRMVLVCGTSTCHMAISRSKLFIPGVWGPFWSGTLLELHIQYLALGIQIILYRLKFD